MNKIAFVVNVDWYFKLHWLNRMWALKNHGFDIILITKFTSQDNKSFFIKNGVECIDWNVSRKGLSLLTELKSYNDLKKILNTLKPAVIHSITVKPNIYSSFVNKGLNACLIKSVTGLGVVFSANTLKYKIIKLIVLFLYRISSCCREAFIFENEADRQMFKKLKITSKNSSYHIGGAGIDMNVFNSNNSILEEDIVKVLFAARMLKDKGLDTLLLAIRKARKNGAVIQLQVAGIIDPESNNSYTVAEIEALALEFKFSWLGQINKMETLLSQVDVVALPSRYGEGIPRVLIEAGACNRLVLTSDIPGCNELITHNVDGLLFPPRDYELMAKSFVDIFNNREKYQRMALTLGQKIEKNYTDEVIINKFIKVYEELLGD